MEQDVQGHNLLEAMLTAANVVSDMKVEKTPGEELDLRNGRGQRSRRGC